MISINNLSLSFGTQELFKDANLMFQDDQKIGLVGRNGTGKSTLLKIINAAQTERDRHISISNGMKIGYMPQEVVLQSPCSILEETMNGHKEYAQLSESLKEITNKLNDAQTDDLLVALAEIQEQLVTLNPDALQAEAKKLLVGLGFSEDKFDTPVANLSVGWKMRVVLAQLLLQKADFYLFDEPTNHLDIVAKDWFMQFLKDSSFGFLLICHERYFLNRLCDYILELELGNAKMYTGDFSTYEEQKEADLALLHKAYEAQQKEIARKEETINRFRAKSSKAKMAQSMIKQLDRIERIEIPPNPKNIHFNFPPVQRSGRKVLEVNNLACAFGDKKIFDHVSFIIERGQKVAVIAPNGVGKTTLFNCIIGKVKPTHGSIEFGANVHASIFEQDQAKALDPQKTILEYLNDNHPKETEQRIRSFLGSFLFDAEDVQKKTKVLSGGEKNKVGMTSVLLTNANFILLDEPTNHLDMQAKDVLLNALNAYQGTILFVSHDHDFINKLATHIIELTPNGAHLYHGNYDAFMAHKKAINKPTQTKAAKVKTDSQPEQSKEAKKQLHQAERAIAKLEAHIQKVEVSFEDLIFGTDAFNKAQEKLGALRMQLEELITEWEKLG